MKILIATAMTLVLAISTAGQAIANPALAIARSVSTRAMVGAAPRTFHTASTLNVLNASREASRSSGAYVFGTFASLRSVYAANDPSWSPSPSVAALIIAEREARAESTQYSNGKLAAPTASTVRALCAQLGSGREANQAAKEVHDFLYANAYKFTMKREAREDLVQETMEKLLRNCSRLLALPSPEVSRYLFVVMRNEWFDTYSVRQRFIVAWPTDSDGEPIEFAIDGDATPQHIVSRAQKDEQVSALIKAFVSQNQRRAALLQAEGLKYKEIAKEMNISTDTVKDHIEKARSKIRKHESILRPYLTE